MKSFADRVNGEWGFELNDADHMQYAVYRRHDFFEWHKDMLRARCGPIRKVSVVLQLSAPELYRGGRLQFLDNDFGRLSPDAFVPRGSVAVFSSLLKHRVTPIKDGERRSLTAWFKGPPFR
jgi:PKHD-type hydroxylase